MLASWSKTKTLNVFFEDGSCVEYKLQGVFNGKHFSINLPLNFRTFPPFSLLLKAVVFQKSIFFFFFLLKAKQSLLIFKLKLAFKACHSHVRQGVYLGETLEKRWLCFSMQQLFLFWLPATTEDQLREPWKSSHLDLQHTSEFLSGLAASRELLILWIDTEDFCFRVLVGGNEEGNLLCKDGFGLKAYFL